MKTRTLRLFALGLVFVLGSIPAFAQKGTYAITNARIVTVSGAPISSGTIVLRDGLIESVGTSVKIPADALQIDGSGLTIYPGFIDPGSSLGLPAPQARGRGAAPQPADSDSNSNYSAGLRPSRQAADELKANESTFDQVRAEGFTTVLTVGSDKIFNGESVVIDLAGDSVSSMIVKRSFAQHVTFTTERGTFPGSLMGTFAAIRQMFNDALRLDRMNKMYAQNPRGIPRPESDPELEALIPVVRGEKQIVFNANSEREIIRALDLAKEYSLKAVISGGTESGRVASRLASQKVPVLLSVNLPMRTTSENPDADPETMSVLRMRADALKNASMLKNAGVRFAFQSAGLKNMGDYQKNVGMIVENGLGKDDAIRAMTLSAAELLGVDAQLGSIEAGKIANLVIAKGELLGKDTTLTHVFVDGKMFELPKKKEMPAGSGPAGAMAKAGGIWNVTVEAPGVSVPLTMNLVQSGNTLTGTISSSMFSTAQIRNGRVSATGMTFDTSVDFQGTSLSLSFTGTINGDNIEGTIQTGQGPATFSGSRAPQTESGGQD